MLRIKSCIALFLFGILFVYLLIVFFLWAFQRELLYHPGEDPGEAPEGWRDLIVVTEDGIKLKAWFKESKSKKSDFCVLYLHGNAGNREEFLVDAALFERFDVPILMIDWRGFGGSEGSPTEKGLYLDAEAGLNALTKATGMDVTRVVVCGRSLGTGPSVYLASKYNIKAVILISPYTSIVDVGQRLYPYAPVSLLCKDRFNVIKIAHKVKCPVLVIVGTKDRLVPMDLSLKLASRFKNHRILKIEGADHNDIVFDTGKEEIIKELERLLLK